MRRKVEINCKCSGDSGVGGVSGVKCRWESRLASIPGALKARDRGALDLTICGMRPEQTAATK